MYVLHDDAQDFWHGFDMVGESGRDLMRQVFTCLKVYVVLIELVLA